MHPIRIVMQANHRIGSTLLAAAMLLSLPVMAAEGPPDLTKGETTGVDRKGTYNLGSTGMRGWIYLKPATHFDGLQGRTTAASRQILVTHVGAKSPADGVMQVDDVILGVGGKLFTDDARRSIAAAIQEAEKEANKGILKLTRLAGGQDRGGAAQAASHGHLQRHRALQLPEVAEDFRRGLQGAGEGTVAGKLGWRDHRPCLVSHRQPRLSAQGAGVRPQDGAAHAEAGTSKRRWAPGRAATATSSCASITCAPATRRCCMPSVKSPSRRREGRACMAPSAMASPT